MAYSKIRISIPNVTGNIVITATAEQSALPTNILDTVGYQNNKRISLSSANSDKVVDAPGCCVTGQIPVANGDVIRMKGYICSNTYKGVAAAWNSSRAYINGTNQNIAPSSNSGTYGTIVVDADSIVTWTIDNANIAYVSFSARCDDGSTLYVTKNEPLPST